MTTFTLRNTDEATWDEQGCTPARLTPLTPSHAHDGAPSGTRRDTPAPGRVTTYREQPTPCTCTTCVRPCLMSIRADLHWVTCRQCRAGRHRRGAA